MFQPISVMQAVGTANMSGVAHAAQWAGLTGCAPVLSSEVDRKVALKPPMLSLACSDSAKIKHSEQHNMIWSYQKCKIIPFWSHEGSTSHVPLLCYHSQHVGTSCTASNRPASREL